MDVYDFLILEVIQNYKKSEHRAIRLGELEKLFWVRIESNPSLSVGMAKLGERIANLYLEGYIENKGGYQVTKKGRNEIVSI